MVDTNWEDLQQLAQRNYNRDLNGALRIATGLRLDVYGICRKLFGKQNEPNEVFSQLTQILSNRALLLDGTSGCFCSTPDAAALDIVGDIDIRVEYVMDPTGSATQGLVAKFSLASGNWSYRFLASNTFGLYTNSWSATGSAELTATSILGLNLNPGAARMTFDVDNGAAGRTTRFFTSATLGLGTEVGSGTVQGGVTSIFSGAAALVVGTATEAGTGNNFKGRITRMELRTGIDGSVVANPDFRALAPGTTSFADGTGKTWTLQGTARIV